MRVRMTGLAGLTALAALLAGATPASAAPGDASAYAAKLELALLGGSAVSAGPFAAADANGPTSGTFAAVDVPGVLKTGVLDASATRDDKTGGVHSRAVTADVRLDLLASAAGPITAEVVEARCDATQKGVTGGSELVGLSLGKLGTVDAEPAPNTVVDVDLLGVDIAKLVFNEQIRNKDGSLTVNAVHLTLIGGVLGALGSGDVVVSSATCGPAGLPIPMASGAGLWIGLGLLGLVAVPTGAVVLRRRQAMA
ncbi:choice-of-anchor P family protein [Saccharothrix sp.]|uniref:choice-of-anchor P family protein n=1 Tax=Saccharothrix sp. TaxID=1873460 RepID=UPI0028115AA1|nr:choice-of-anchor P family protein [Saccharothrix sp.]